MYVRQKEGLMEERKDGERVEERVCLNGEREGPWTAEQERGDWTDGSLIERDRNILMHQNIVINTC